MGWNDNFDVLYDNNNILNDDLNKTSKKLPTRIIMPGDLVYFATIVGNVNMSSYWYHWCDLSPKDWVNKNHLVENE